MNVTVKGIILALIAVIALIALLIWINTLQPSETPTERSRREAHVVTEEPDVEDPDFNEPIFDLGYVVDERDEHIFYSGSLELPVIGATGWTATNVTLREEASPSADRVAYLSSGEAFTILIEDGDWWYVRVPNGTDGWVESSRCLINLPDVLPSIIYSISNAYSSMFHSSGYPLPGITYTELYSAYSHNDRLDRGEFIVPGMYSLAKALYDVQQLALANDETLIIYEAFRPRDTQRAVAAALNRMMDMEDEEYNSTVHRAIADSRWTVGNFISQGRSNHQLGAAVDSSIGLVNDKELMQSGDYSYFQVTRHTRIGEPSPMHELSPRAVLPSRNVGTLNDIGESIWNMKSYFERVGFTPLASEWWHFNHSASVRSGSSAGMVGDFFTPEVFSVPPVR